MSASTPFKGHLVRRFKKSLKSDSNNEPPPANGAENGLLFTRDRGSASVAARPGGVDHPIQENLCLECRSLIGKLDDYMREFESGKIYIRLEDPKDFKSWGIAAAMGCTLCQAFVRGFLDDSEFNLPSSTLYEEASSLEFSGGHNCLRTTKESSVVDSFYAEREVYSKGKWFISAVWFFRCQSTSSTKLEVSTSSASSISFIKDSLETCRISHPECQGLRSLSLKPPTRLIELREGGCRLRTDVSNATPYTTLSHCWGTIDMFKLKKDNIIDLQREIQLDKLPKTFQDAIFVTRSLGFNHIWIDSMCIIQDDVDDWRRESAQMTEVYGNSSVNIAATYAENGSVGLFVDKDLSRMEKQCIMSPQGSLFQFVESGFYERSISHAPLSSRAWTFQERYLAPRTLHFTGEQIFWTCRTIMACERLPNGFPIDMIHRQHEFPSNADPRKWCQTVSLYSRANLTYSTDKLIAVSGVAHRFQDQSPDQYLAGLWRDNIERQLCWRMPLLNGGSKNTASPYRAPSWSWASTDHLVTWELYTTNDVSLEEPGQESLIQILNFSVVLAGRDSLGQLKSAELQLKCGPLIDAATLTEKGLTKNGKIYYDMDGRAQEGSSSYLLPTLRQKQHGELVLFGIIVQRAEERGKGSFVRVGAFNVQFKDVVLNYDPARGMATAYLGLLDIMSALPAGLIDESSYQEILEPDSNGVKQYSVTLI